MKNLTKDEQNYLPIFLNLVEKNEIIFSHIEDGSKEDIAINGILQKLSSSYNDLLYYKETNEVELSELKELYTRKCLQKRQLEKDIYEANKLLIDNGLKANPIKKNYRSS